MQTLEWHQNNCPCQGKPQPVRKKLASRQSTVSSSGMQLLGNGKQAFFRKPGSQNRNK